MLVVHQDNPGEIVAVKLGSPLLFGYDDTGEFYFSSDSQALAGYADKLINLEDGDILHLQSQDFIITTGGKPTVRTVEELDQEALEVSK
ncbi:MAG: hypothetical protein H6765_01370 [Candidatus Peribacteria bacterium]|nr:MAG: hypothetical protein H6765_01370 [Candidatus Peribacteria bacterium]